MLIYVRSREKGRFLHDLCSEESDARVLRKKSSNHTLSNRVEALRCASLFTPEISITYTRTEIAKHMRRGRQEDSHEFLRYAVDSMQKSCLAGNE